MNIFITGGTGYVGSAFISELLNDNRFADADQIFVLTRNSGKIPANWRSDKRIIIITGDLLDFKLDSEIIIDVVLHFAAYTGADRELLKKTNIFGTRRLCEMFNNRRGLKKFVYLSSVAVINGNILPTGKKFTNSLDYQAADDYGNSKIAAEKTALNFGNLPLIILRPAFICGKDRYFNTIAARFKKLRLKFVVTGKDYYWHFLRIETLIREIISIIFVSENKANTDSNSNISASPCRPAQPVIRMLAEPEPVRVKKIYTDIAKSVGGAPPIFISPAFYKFIKVINRILFFLPRRYNIENNIAAKHLFNEIYEIESKS